MRNPSQTVLVVDDTADIHKLVSFLLKDFSLEFGHAMGGRDGVDMAINLVPDLILLDYDMPDMNGLQVLKQIRDTPSLASIPVIFITASHEQSLIADVFASGATDYIRKPLLASELQARVRASLKTHALIKELAYQAKFDQLTELPNRWSMLEEIELAIRRKSQESNKPFAIFHINFDRFRLINETLGREVGDSLLKQAAKRIQRVMATSKVIQSRCKPQFAARLDSDEFLLLVDGVSDVADLEMIAEKMLLSISDRYAVGLHSLHVESSIGIVLSNPKYTSANDLLRDADTAMHEAKLSGRHRYRIFDDSMREKAKFKLEMENDLRRAIEKQEFELLYQPLLKLSTGQVASVEALIRWNHTSRGMIGPSEFIASAEETGLIVDIGAWCIQTACHQLAQWQHDHPAHSPHAVNINIARQQLIQPTFLEDLRIVLDETRLSPPAVHLEITESEMMVDMKVAIEVMTELRKFGVKIDIDDFGTGHSSLACLNQFPVDVLKLDRSLISGISERGFSARLVDLVLNLAKDSSVAVVAEGIETIAQEQSLILWGCEFGQGFLYSKPLHAIDVPYFIESQNSTSGKQKPRRVLNAPLTPASSYLGTDQTSNLTNI